ncbi:MAG: GNAT family N-acetyltransferase [Phenylobacterium sp.]|uniref:GNAT family N-acetyltransferase n=1 Tax=Phenylobacterium sp. TaxID=1871053 RepID=UPI00121F7D38|nr:GNAT family N-acetyltransferase [Phenylobacterium sp.]TAJ69119.1 MAG: GNAT family N-acetyltransferase [Phenylobacterium sp.]
MLSDGYHDVDPHKIVTVETSLEMFARPPRRAASAPAGARLVRLENVGAEEYLDLYRAVGRDWLWFMRLALSEAELLAIVGDPLVEVYRLEADGGVGILELDFREPGECELAFFGLSPGLVGTGAGRWLMEQAQDLAWSRPIRRFWVHTCTLDAQGAVAFYMRSGFVPFRRKVEITDDPRHLGKSPRDSAPHFPLIE